MTDNKAKDIVFDILEMEVMYRENCRAYEEYLKKQASMSAKQKYMSKDIAVVPYSSFQHYIDKAMQDMADSSHGDIVVTELGVEIKRVKANYKKAKMYGRITKEE